MEELAQPAAEVGRATAKILLLDHVSYCGAFRQWGRLDVLPVLMDCYLSLRLKNTPEVSMLTTWMEEMLTSDEGSLLGMDPPDESLEDYFSLVMAEYDARRSHLVGPCGTFLTNTAGDSGSNVDKVESRRLYSCRGAALSRG